MAMKKTQANDDIKRGNVGTGDQGSGDVNTHDKVGPKTGQVKPTDVKKQARLEGRR